MNRHRSGTCLGDIILHLEDLIHTTSIDTYCQQPKLAASVTENLCSNLFLAYWTQG